MAKRGRKGSAGGPPANKSGGTGGPPVGDYRHHGAKRKNNPPAKIAAEGTVPVIPKAQYAYNPHLPPVLRFNPSPLADARGSDQGRDREGAVPTDRLPPLIAEAGRRPLTPDEQRLLAEALRRHEPWLEWTGKRERKSFEVDPVALHIHERVSTQAILKIAARQDVQRSLFADPQQEYHEAVQFYRHDVDWANRLILGDSLQVMSSLARREDLAGKVQMIYMDPPYGIKFASNFQPEVGRRDVKDKEQDLTREPEMVRAYRDTWHLGIHSYLSYLRDRLIVARELLGDTGSIFVQISDENVHRVRELLDEVFGPEHFFAQINYRSMTALGQKGMAKVYDYLLWYCREQSKMKFVPLWERTDISVDPGEYTFVAAPGGSSQKIAPDEVRSLEDQRVVFKRSDLNSSGYTPSCVYAFEFAGRSWSPTSAKSWRTNPSGMERLVRAERLFLMGEKPYFRQYLGDFGSQNLENSWHDTAAGFSDRKQYVVQTHEKIIHRCMLMTTDPGDLVLDPTCGSGTTAYVAEHWGRRWITIDTSRVAIAIARQRLLTAKYHFYALRPLTSDDTARNHNGTWLREPDDPKSAPRTFACKTVPHITLKTIAQNVALDPIFAKHEPILDRALADCKAALARVTPELRAKLAGKLARKEREEGKRAITAADRRRWDLPCATAVSAVAGAGERAGGEEHCSQSSGTPGARFEHWTVPFDTDPDWPKELQTAVTEYRRSWRAKMDAVNACIAASAEQEELVDQPEVVRGIVRVSGPLTVEAVQPPEMSLGDNIDPYTGGVGVSPANGGLFAGEPEQLPEGFDARTLRVVEPRPDLDAKNVSAYLEQMFRYLKADGVRFLNNRQMKWTRFEPLFESGKAGGFHAEGRWVTVTNGGKEPSPQPSPSKGEGEEDGPSNVGVVFGPQYGPVTAKMVEEVIRQANRAGYDHLVIAGFSFDGAATAIISENEEGVPGRGGRVLRVHLAHIRPDINPGMNGLLKESPQPGAGQLFTVFGLPRVRVAPATAVSAVRGSQSGGTPEEYVVTMEGVDVYNPVDNSIASTGASKVAAWFLDGDYDGRTFCITQAFFPDKSAWEKLARVLNGKDGPIDAERFEAFSGTTSLPFPAGKHRCVAVKVIDPRGNEVMSVQKL